eukprot:TRINITY_DN23207_c0_g1_i1.p1 TRINITY_DN23207_c0_g1~~TRINITY_DN23207_c0_g1_i1.p1  ORF type:complete len:203 (-),score=39.82 TRINITY_DN23207_c0_g1_i1:129-737(-)
MALSTSTGVAPSSKLCARMLASWNAQHLPHPVTFVEDRKSECCRRHAAAKPIPAAAPTPRWRKTLGDEIEEVEATGSPCDETDFTSGTNSREVHSHGSTEAELACKEQAGATRQTSTATTTDYRTQTMSMMSLPSIPEHDYYYSEDSLEDDTSSCTSSLSDASSDFSDEEDTYADCLDEESAAVAQTSDSLESFRKLTVTGK